MQSTLEDDVDHSPFRGKKKSKTPHPPSSSHYPPAHDYSPIKGKHDPNMASFARQNLAARQTQIQQLAWMSMQELNSLKQEVSDRRAYAR